VKKVAVILILVPVLYWGGQLFFLLQPNGNVLLQSRESKTATGGPVFNRVHFERREGKEIWMMQQSHHGALARDENWDRLAIVVDPRSRQARFYQFEPGPLQWEGGMRQRPFRVACFLCHVNGPRAIRPAGVFPLSLSDRLKVLAWNARIVLYGRLLPDPENEKENSGFSFHKPFAREPLPLRACLVCHNDSAWGRGKLLRQHFMPVRFLVNKGHMPPLGYGLSLDEERILERFFDGL
jgi:hypothetical protein